MLGGWLEGSCLVGGWVFACLAGWLMATRLEGWLVSLLIVDGLFVDGLLVG